MQTVFTVIWFQTSLTKVLKPRHQARQSQKVVIEFMKAKSDSVPPWNIFLLVILPKLYEEGFQIELKVILKKTKKRGLAKVFTQLAQRCWLDKVGTLPLGWLIPSGKIGGNTLSLCKSLNQIYHLIWWKVKVGWRENTFLPLQITQN